MLSIEADDNDSIHDSPLHLRMQKNITVINTLIIQSLKPVNKRNSEIN